MTFVVGFLLAMGIWFWAVFDCLSTPADRVRRLPKIAWLVILFLLWWVAALAWFWFGRPGARTDPWRTFQQTARVPNSSSTPPIGPDDDPDFLNGLG